LRSAIKLTTQAINAKTDAFVLEGTTVGQVVGKEISALMKLKTVAGEVKDVVASVVTDTNTTTDDSGSNKKGGSKKKKDDSQSDDGGSKKTTKTELNQLAKLYAQFGTLRAQFEGSNNKEQLAQLQNLTAEIRRRQELLSLTKEESAALKEKAKISYEESKRVVEAAKKQQAIDEQRKALEQAKKKQDKLDEQEWKRKIKEE
jgi:hypothetical protein